METLCRTCSQPLSVCACPIPAPPETLHRVTRLHRARLAALQWYCVQLVGATDSGVRATLWATMQQLLDANEAALAPWLTRQRDVKMPPTEFLSRHHVYREVFFDKHGRWPTLTEEAIDLGLDRKTVWSYLHPGRLRKKNRPKR